MHERTKQLLDIMERYKLSVRDVAEITERTEQTVRVWRSKYGARIIPAQTLKLVETEMQLRTGELPLRGGKA